MSQIIGEFSALAVTLTFGFSTLPAMISSVGNSCLAPETRRVIRIAKADRVTVVPSPTPTQTIAAVR